MQSSFDQYKPYVSALCLSIIPVLLWYSFYFAEPAELQYQDYGVVLHKSKEHPAGTDQWKCALVVENPSGKRSKLYTSEKVFNAYKDGDTIAFRCPLKNVKETTEDF